MKNFPPIILLLILLFGCNEEKPNNYLPSSWISSEVISLCDSTDLQIAPQSLVSKYEKNNYYNKQFKRSQHEITVNFDFIAECCREFYIEYRIDNTILYIEYIAKETDVCECKCNYRGMLNLGDNSFNFNSIKRVIIKQK